MNANGIRTTHSSNLSGICTDLGSGHTAAAAGESADCSVERDVLRDRLGAGMSVGLYVRDEFWLAAPAMLAVSQPLDRDLRVIHVASH
jgi:hypothetical protein